MVDSAKGRLEEGDIALLAPLITKVGKQRELKCTSFHHSKKSVSVNKTTDPNIMSQREFCNKLCPVSGPFFESK